MRIFSNAAYVNRGLIGVAVVAILAGLISPLLKPAPTDPIELTVVGQSLEDARVALENFGSGRPNIFPASTDRQALELDRERRALEQEVRALELYEQNIKMPARLERTTADKLGVPLDSAGRPYDSEWYLDGTVAEQTNVGTIALRFSNLYLFDGGALMFNDPEPELLGAVVDFDGASEAEVSTLWQVSLDAGGEEQFRSLVGVRLDVPDREVDAWGPFDFGYDARIDGPMNGLSSALPLRDDEGRLGRSLVDNEVFDYYLGDNDVLPGNDTLIFGNGYGSPSSMPLSVGRDADGYTASVVFWQNWFPWRMAITDGTPPPDVTTRENEFLECIAGLRPVHTTTDECLPGALADVLAQVDLN